MSPKRLLAAILLGATAVATWTLAYPFMFDRFNAFDDEGYLLVSLKEFMQHGHLYDQVYTQYGPLYYLFMDGLFTTLRMPVDHDHGRLWTLTVWTAVSLAIGVITYRATERISLAWLTQLLAVFLLQGLIGEPMHPNGLLDVLLVAVMYVVLLVPGRRLPVLFALLGVLSAAAVLIKVNVGGFTSIALAFTVLLAIRQRGFLRMLRLPLAALLSLTPFLVIGRTASQHWALTYAVAVTLSALALLVASLAVRDGVEVRRPGRAVAIASACALGLVCVVALGVVASGTSAAGLLNGMLVAPLRQAEVFTIPLRIWGGEPWWALGALLLALAVTAQRMRKLGAFALPGPLPSLLRFVAGFGILFFALTGLGIEGAALAWVIVVRGSGAARPPSEFARLALASIAVLQALQPFPVAGSQWASAGLTLLPVGAVALNDALAGLVPELLPRPARLLSALPVTAFALAFLVIVLVPFTSQNQVQYRQGTAIGVPGTDRLRLPPEQAGAYRRLTADLDADCSTFVSLPGQNSLYLFAGSTPPTGYNTTAWMFLLDGRQQDAIVAALEASPRPCVVENDLLLGFWTSRTGLSLSGSPLYRYILENFTPADQVDEFKVLEPKASSSGDSFPGGGEVG